MRLCVHSAIIKVQIVVKVEALPWARIAILLKTKTKSSSASRKCSIMLSKKVSQVRVLKTLVVSTMTLYSARRKEVISVNKEAVRVEDQQFHVEQGLILFAIAENGDANVRSHLRKDAKVSSHNVLKVNILHVKQMVGNAE